MESWRTTWSA